MTDLFSSISIGGIVAKNHFVRSATHEGKATPDGRMTPELFDVYRRLCEGGVGTIITGYTHITKQDQPASKMMAIYDSSYIDEYRELTAMCHEHDVPIIMQLVYGGYRTQGDHGSKEVWGPSDNFSERSGVTAKEMTKGDIAALRRAFAEAAQRAQEAGFDGVQLHGAHGYLISQFLSPHENHRTDEYGGSIENRARLALDVLQTVRNAVGDDFPIWIKINSADYVDGGLTFEDSLAASVMLAQAGIDAIEVSRGGGFPEPTNRKEESFCKDYAVELADMVPTPVILTGGNRTLETMQGIADWSNCSLFGLSRPLFKNPDFLKTLK